MTVDQQPTEPRRRRTVPRARSEGRVRARAVAAELGRRVRDARLRRKWSQRELGSKIGVNQTYISKLERGLALKVPLEIWLAIGRALGILLRVEFARDQLLELSDAGHLAIQELALKLGRTTSRGRTFELATKPADPALSVDVGLRDDRIRVLVLIECWNTFGNLGASIRNTRRKVAEAEQLAAAIAGDGPPYRVTACWIVRDTKRNRELVARYPELFAATFTGSSAGWVRALTTPGIEPPSELGLVWCDVRSTRVTPWRRAAP